MRKDRPERKESEVIGLIPAGGQAKRLSPLPCSKELYPIGFERTDAAAQVSKEPFLDIGTPDDLVRALRDLASRGK